MENQEYWHNKAVGIWKDLKEKNFYCSSCEEFRKESDFHKGLTGKNGTCKECKKNKVRERRLKVMEAYGQVCVCCGETELEFLTVDHINGGGTQHRKKVRGRLYDWLIKNNYPKDEYQILCMNCNLAKGVFGKCPHQK
jgi:hypothetical protein